MAWFKIDDGFWSHPKVIGLSSNAVALWVRAGSYCAQHLTGGVVAPAAVRLLGAPQEAADELVECGLWDSKPDSYVFHDWDVYQPSSSTTKEKRDELSRKRAEAGRKGASARWKQTDSNTDANLPKLPNGNEMAPSRPVPSVPTDVGTNVSSDKSDDATLIPEAWRPTQDHCDKAASLHLDVVHEYQRFREHAERNHRRLKNWNAGFTNWLKKGAELAQQRQGQASARRAPAVQDNLARLAQLEAEENSHDQRRIAP